LSGDMASNEKRVRKKTKYRLDKRAKHGARGRRGREKRRQKKQ